MDTLWHNIGKAVASFLISLGIIAVPAVQPQNLGTAVPTQGALYDSYLSSSISASATSMTLAKGTYNDGTSLTGWTCFTVDSNSPSVEYICGTASGTAITSLW